MQKMKCENCEKEIRRNTYWQKFCSTNCRIETFFRNKRLKGTEHNENIGKSGRKARR